MRGLFGKTEPMNDEPPIDITTSNVYEWLPGEFWILHTAYGRLGNMEVGGVEMIGYNRETVSLESARADHLDGDGTIQEGVLCAVHNPHAAASHFSENLIWIAVGGHVFWSVI